MPNYNVFAQKPDGTLLIDPIIVTGSATSDSSSHWTLDISNVGLTHVYSVTAEAKSADNSAANSVTASVSTFSTTTVAGGVSKPLTVGALGGSPVQGAGSDVVVYITVVGDVG